MKFFIGCDFGFRNDLCVYNVFFIENGFIKIIEAQKYNRHKFKNEDEFDLEVEKIAQYYSAIILHTKY